MQGKAASAAVAHAWCPAASSFPIAAASYNVRSSSIKPFVPGLFLHSLCCRRDALHCFLRQQEVCATRAHCSLARAHERPPDAGSQSVRSYNLVLLACSRLAQWWHNMSFSSSPNPNFLLPLQALLRTPTRPGACAILLSGPKQGRWWPPLPQPRCVRLAAGRIVRLRHLPLRCCSVCACASVVPLCTHCALGTPSIVEHTVQQAGGAQRALLRTLAARGSEQAWRFFGWGWLVLFLL